MNGNIRYMWNGIRATLHGYTDIFIKSGKECGRLFGIKILLWFDFLLARTAVVFFHPNLHF